MSDDYLPLLLANMQQEIADLRQRVEMLEQATADMADEGEEPDTYMDGTPIR